MSINWSTPWHKASFDKLMQERLPQLLAERLPLTGYHVESTGRYTCRIEVMLAAASGDVQLTYDGIPQPDESGQFEIKGELRVFVPTASHGDLDTATFRCVGERLYEYIESRLAQAPSNLPWDADLARAWLPLDAWIDQFMQDISQSLDTTNWLSRQTHLRRMNVLDNEKLVAPGQASRVCPFEMPEGYNLGRVFTIAVGAEIRDGKLVVVDERPEANLGLSASMIPFIENSDPNRLLMGANMLRQALVPPDPEPALVQTGNEPDVPDFWCGRNLLTAFVSWGADTCYDGIVISQSCAQRLNYPYPAEPGDKLSNRHGTKGVVSRVLPDDEMPHLPDGTPVELVFNFLGMHVRMNFGQVREAVMGRIACVEYNGAEGQPVIVPPFGAPKQDELRQRLAQAGLPESGVGYNGMETLTLGRNGQKLERPSFVGWVYWFRLAHLARHKVQTPPDTGQVQDELDLQALRNLGAYENLREYLNTRSTRREDGHALAARIAAGPIEQAEPPTPLFANLASRLRVAGIEAVLAENKLMFRWLPSQQDALRLARPVAHPWLHERPLTEIGPFNAEIIMRDKHEAPDLYWLPPAPPVLPLEEYRLLVEANERLARMISSRTPERLMQDATAQLQARVNVFLEALLTPAHLSLNERQLLSACSVIAPGAGLRLDQVGLPEGIAWALFAPLVIRDMRDEAAVRARTEQAAQILDQVMARSWVIVNHVPLYGPAAPVAFHPVREASQVIRLHPLVCDWLNADFDGDRAVVLLPITEGAQREAGEKLSVAAHLARDPKRVESLLLPAEALWGLASLGLTEHGRQEIVRLAGIEIEMPNGVITQATLAEALHKKLARDGVEQTLSALEQLVRRGWEAVKASGASMSPFLGASQARPPMPVEDTPEAWNTYQEELSEAILSRTDYADVDLGPQLLAVSIRARGRWTLPRLIGPWGVVNDIHGKPLAVRHTNVEGLTSEEMYARVLAARKGLRARADEMEQLANGHRESNRFTVLARARQAQHPGVVFARAAAIGQVDPLTDVDSRLLVGLPVGQERV